MGTGCLAVNYLKNILPLSSQCIFSSLLFIVNSRDYFVSNSVYHNNNTKEMVYTNLRELWICVRRDLIIQALKYVTIIPKQLRNLQQAL
jgi:hypothetical protein